MPGEELGTYIIRKSFSEIYLKNRKVVVRTNNEHICILRIIATPSDTICIKGGYTFINQQQANESNKVRSSFIKSISMPYKIQHAIERQCNCNMSTDTIQLPINQIRQEWKAYLRPPMLKNIPDDRIYPSNDKIHWNAYNIDALILPHKGYTIKLNETNRAIYTPIIERYEEADLTSADSTYTFRKNYIWVMCDNRDICSDSRTFGPIPTDNILGIVKFKLW